MTTARANKKQSQADEGAAPIWRWSILLGSLVLWLLFVASLVSYSPADAPTHAVVPVNSPPANWIGPVGAYLASQSFDLLGVGVWITLASSGLWLGLAVVRRPINQPALRIVGVALLALAVSGFEALFFPNAGTAPQGAGGLIAIAGVAELTARFSTLGSALWLLLLAGVGAIVAFDQWLITIPAYLWSHIAPHLGVAVGKTRDTLAARRERRRVRATDLEDDRRLEQVAPQNDARYAPPAQDEEEYEEDEYEDVEEDVEADEDEDDLPGAPQVFDANAAREKIAGLPIRFASAARSDSTENHLHDIQNAVDLEHYKFPGLDLLEDPEESYSEEMEEFVRNQAEALENALQVYRIDGEVVGIDSGPVITLYEVRLAPGAKVSRLTAVSSDIARALKAINIRIVPNMAGRDTVGVEVPNLKKEKVRLKELMTCAQDADRVSRMKLPMFLGKDASGEPLIEDLADMPHALVAGTTGSGKSVCLNTIIMSFLFTKKPNELKLVLIDPKMVELSGFRDIPHLMCPVVTEMSKAAAILEWAVAKMDERYALLVEAGVRDIASYNNLDEEDLLERMDPATEREAALIPRKLPYIVFIIDELADMMMTHKEVEGSIVRIAQKARAVGIHLVLATQRPQANVVTGLIKSNMPARMTFKVASGMDSRIVLDQKGGELLLGQGDMLFLSPRSHKLMRAQGTLVDDRETRRVVRFLRDVAAPSYERQLVQIKSADQSHADEAEGRGLQSALEDPLFEKAVDIVLETKRGSVSLLQRRLAIGYTRASRLVDLMGEVGVIGAYKGTVARKVVVTPEQWDDMRQQLRTLAQGGQQDLFETDAAAESPPYRVAPPEESIQEQDVSDHQDAADEEEDQEDYSIEDETEDAEVEDEIEETDEIEEEEEEEEAEADDDAEEVDEDDEYEYEYEYVDEEDEEKEAEASDEAEDENELEVEDSEEEADPQVHTAPFQSNRPAAQS